MLLDTDIYGGAGNATRTNASGVMRVPDQEPKSDLGVAAASHEVGERERVPDRPPVLTVETFLDWSPKYYQQCIADGRARVFKTPSPELTAFLKRNQQNLK